ncbi:guanylate kinase [Sulfoacidibacillus thermotolerans]|uniref:Guanylate kinase n=1 Tax=Sulfoacidibacillus thermotolerans TaxID=1765684 RepID=A0A2U3D8J5_SULT2|nr:guanylate kinase [Sulfoacidibacillus thermotolerans]
MPFRPEDQQDRPGYFFILSGPSGVGKNTLLGIVLQGLSGVYYMPSATTRPMRPGESQLNPYVFVSKDEFEEMIERGQFLEWKKIHTNDYYGTHLPSIRYAIENGYDIITDMDVLGCADAVAAFPEHICTIFIMPPSLDELSNRLYSRDADQRNIQKRLERVELEMKYQDKYDFVVVNDNLDESAQQLREIIQEVRTSKNFKGKREVPQ